MPIKRKLVIVSDGKVGKNSLLRRFAQTESIDDPECTNDYFKVDVEVDGKVVKMELCDTAWQADYNQIRPYAYMNANVMLIIFSLIDPQSLEKAINKWLPEVKHFCPNVPIILVGNKNDLRNDQNLIKALAKINLKPITTEEGTIIAKKNGISAYMECSAKTNDCVQEVFKSSVRAALQANQRSRNQVPVLNKCCLF